MRACSLAELRALDPHGKQRAPCRTRECANGDPASPYRWRPGGGLRALPVEQSVDANGERAPVLGCSIAAANGTARRTFVDVAPFVDSWIERKARDESRWSKLSCVARRGKSAGRRPRLRR